MAKRKQRAKRRDETELALAPRRTRRFMRRSRLLLLLLVGLMVAAPTVISYTSLHNRLLDQLPSGWQLQSKQASLGWTSNQSLFEISLFDDEGNELLTAESATVHRSLLSLAFDPTDLGSLQFVRPVVYLETWPDGSNWEDLLTALLAEQQTQSAAIRLNIDVVEGVVRAVDRQTGQQWTLDEANVTASLGDGVEVNGSARLATQQRPQSGGVKLSWLPTDDGQQHLELLADRLPLSPLQPWLARVLPGAELMGALSADAQLTWAIDPQRGLMMQTVGRLEATQLDTTAAALTGDRLRCQKLSAPWKISLTDGQLNIEQLSVNADWAELQAKGALNLTDWQGLSLDSLPAQPVSLFGKLDLAQLTNMLPSSLQLREGVRIESGKLTFDAGSKREDQQIGWQAKLALHDIVGSDGQRQIRWTQPIEATAAIKQSPSGPQIDQVTLTAPFAKATMLAKREAIEGEFELDLHQLSQELGQFVDLQAWQLQGLGEGTFTLARQSEQQFTATGRVDWTDLNVSDGQHTVWSEPKLHVELQATGKEQNLSPRIVTTGKLQLRGPRDQLEIELLEPLELREQQPISKVQLSGHGPLQLWASRLRPWLANLPQQLEGDAHLQAKLLLAADAVQVIESQGSVVQLRMKSDTLTIDEPRVEFSGQGRWDQKSRSLQTPELQLLGSSFSCRVSDLDVALASPDAPTARGNIAFSADCERLAAMRGWVGQSASTWPRGTATGQVQLTSSAEQLLADFGMTVERLELARMTAASGAVYGKPEIVWREPKLEVTGEAKYDVAADRLQFDKLQIQGKTLRLNSSAGVDRLSTEGLLQANGLLEYDATELAKLVASYTGQGVKIQGDQQVRFQLAGSLSERPGNAPPHWTQQWNMTAEAGWASAGAYGLPIGGGRLIGTLQAGQLQVAPLDVAIGQGRLTVEPKFRLQPGAEQLVLPKGPLVTNVAISPEVSETMLKYIAPILEGATRTEGQFSVDLDLAEVPLERPQLARVQGRLKAHRLSISPGPMVEQLTTLVKQIEALTKRKQFLQAATSSSSKSFLSVTEQQVDFQVVEGRVYHRNLEFMIDNVPVRSYGSVGFDQTLALVIEVPIQDKWIESEPALRGFAGQSLQIPIQGTFQKPKIDERAVANLSAQLLQGAATQAIGDELNRQLEKLFRGK